MSRYLLIAIVLCAVGCSAVATEPRPEGYYGSAKSDAGTESLFRASGEGLEDRDIERILNHRLRLPEQSRIAILRLSTESYWRYYSSDFNQLTDSIANDFIGQMRLSPRVYDASFLPSLLVPEQRTVPFLREAAARYQADLLLAYRTNCRTYDRHRIVSQSETRAYCSVEAVLLDVRSGIIPFTVVASKEFSATKEKDDTNFRETVRRAELAAISESLSEVASELNRFLADVEAM